MQLTLHIGTTKTGTTSIQSALGDPAAVPGQVHYPRAGRRNRGAHHNLAYEVGTRFAEQGRFSADAGGWDDVERELAECGKDRAVVSSEAFSYFTPRDVSVLRERLAGHDVRIVLYVRRHDQWFHSRLVQQTKFGRATLVVDDYLKTLASEGPVHGFTPHTQIARTWSEAFGIERLSVYRFEKPTIGTNVVEHFALVAGIDPLGLPKTNARSNTKAPLKALVAAGHVTNLCRDALQEDFRLSPNLAGKISSFFAQRPDFLDRYSLFSIEHARRVKEIFAADEGDLSALADLSPTTFLPIEEREYADYVEAPMSLYSAFAEEELDFIRHLAATALKFARKGQ